MPEQKRSSRPSSNQPDPRAGRQRPTRRKASTTDRVFVGFDLVFVVLLGALHAVPTAYPQFWWLQLLCAAGLAHRVARAGAGRSALLGFAFGTAWLCAGTWWLYVSMHRYGGLSAPLAGGAVLALCLLYTSDAADE